VAAGAVAPAVAERRTTTAFDRIRALPDHRLVDGLLRSQAWIWVIGIALGGIVFMQVHLLKLNAGSAGGGVLFDARAAVRRAPAERRPAVVGPAHRGRPPSAQEW
jgi:hypothetical protein